MTRGYLISDGFRDRIERTIERVAGTPYGGGITNVTPRLEMVPSQPGDVLRLAAYPRTATWAKGKTMRVVFYTHSGTAFGLSGAGTAGTATALNVSGEFLVLPNGDDNPSIGPSPTMTWCIIGKSKGGANVALEAQQPPIRLAAYDISQGPWEKGTSRQIAFYDVVGGSIAFSGVTATAGNVSQTFYPMATASSGTAVGPTPTMAWAVVSESPSGHLLAVEAENDPIVRLATTQSSGQWQRGSMRTVRITGTTRTEDVYSNFDYYSELDLQQGIIYAKTPYAPAGGTANVVIGPSPVPLHSAVYTASQSWAKGEVKQVVIPPSDGVTQTRSVSVANEYFDELEGDGKKLAIGKFGTAYHVISAEVEAVPVKTAQRTEFGDKDQPWGIGSSRNVNLVGTTQTQQVLSVFDSYSHLDMRKGLAVAKARNPENPESTALIVISPSPRPLHRATTTESGSWVKDEEKVLTVPAGDGRTANLPINVTNKFYDSIELDGKPVAVGKFGDQYFALTGGSAEGVKTGQRTSFGNKDQPWGIGSRRNVTIVGTTKTEEVLSVFDSYSHLDMRKGLAVAKAKDPEDPSSTAYIVISPAPRPLYQATTTETGSWQKDEEKVMTVPAGDGRPSNLTINVTNKFYDRIKLDGTPIAVGKFGDQYYALTGGGERQAEMAHRLDESQWDLGSQRQIRIHGTTGAVQAWNASGHYDAFDGCRGCGLPGLAVIKGVDPFLEGTAYYVIAPPPLRFATGQFTGSWSINAEKEIQVYAGIGDPAVVNVTNTFFDFPNATSPVPCAVAKRGSQWFLVNVPIETATAVFIRQTATITYLGTQSTSRITFLGTGATSQISFLSSASTSQITFLSAGETSELRYFEAGEEMTCEYLKDVTVTCDENGELQVEKETGECTFIPVGEEKTATIISVSGTQTAATINVSGTQTAAIINVNATQTATIVNVGATQTMVAVTSTYTATFLKFKV